MLLGLLDPDPVPSIIKQNSKKTLDSYCFVTPVPSIIKQNSKKNLDSYCFVTSL
jgi:hypothetical protein